VLAAVAGRIDLGAEMQQDRAILVGAHAADAQFAIAFVHLLLRMTVASVP
jgi:hypothetical protein